MPPKSRALTLTLAVAILMAPALSMGKIVSESGEQHPDMRYNLESDEEVEFRGIGTIECRNEDEIFDTTGFVAINSRTVVTVGHYRYIGKYGEIASAGFEPSECNFLLRTSDGSEVIFRSHFNEIANGLEGHPDIPPHRDWAVLRLKDAAPKSVAPLGIIQPSGNRLGSGELSILFNSYLIGYSGSNRNPLRKTISVDCKVRNANTSIVIFHHYCDTGPGSSGSPVLIDVDGVPTAFGINIADGLGNYNIGLKIGPELIAASGGAVTSLTENLIQNRHFTGR